MAYTSPLKIAHAFAPRTRKLTDRQARQIKNLAAEMEANGIPDWRAKLAVQYGVHESTIYGLVVGRRKPHVAC